MVSSSTISNASVHKIEVQKMVFMHFYSIFRVATSRLTASTEGGHFRASITRSHYPSFYGGLRGLTATDSGKSSRKNKVGAIESVSSQFDDFYRATKRKIK